MLSMPMSFACERRRIIVETKAKSPAPATDLVNLERCQSWALAHQSPMLSPKLAPFNLSASPNFFFL